MDGFPDVVREPLQYLQASHVSLFPSSVVNDAPRKEGVEQYHSVRCHQIQLRSKTGSSGLVGFMKVVLSLPELGQIRGNAQDYSPASCRR